MAEFFDRFEEEIPMPKPEKPLCKDCKWVAPAVMSRNSFCNHSKADHSLVDGEPSQRCEGLRQFGTCAPEGRLFEAKDEQSRRLSELAEIQSKAQHLMRLCGNSKLSLTAEEYKVAIKVMCEVYNWANAEIYIIKESQKSPQLKNI